MKNYEEVPNIISGKDLDYLSDMFNWNYGALKSTNQSLEESNDEEIKGVLEKGYTLFKNNLDEVLNILAGGTNE